MKDAQDWNDRERQVAVERLTALWALNEAALGGLIHSLKIPFTGIAVVSIAVVLISLIAFFARRKGQAILKATVIVLLVKAVASPHTPVTAHAAVAFQGLAGAVLFGLMPSARIAAFGLGLLALWEGAAQKIIVLTLLYGKPLWESVDALGRLLLDRGGAQSEALSPTGWVLAAYFGYYTVAGLVSGWLAGVLPREIEQSLKTGNIPAPRRQETPVFDSALARRSRLPSFFKIALILCVMVVISILLQPGHAGLARAAWIMTRAAIAVSLWMIALRPFVRRLADRFLRRGRGLYGAEVARTMDELPRLRGMAIAAWKETSAPGGFHLRWKRFLTRLIVHSLMEADDKDRAAS